MVKTAVSSINGKRTERQKQLADMRKLDISDKYVMYAYADRAKLMKELNIPIADEMLAKESQAVRGALYSLSYSDLSPEMRVGLVLDQKKLKDTRILSKLTAYEPSIHRVGNRIDSEDSLMYLSVNNIDEMMKSMIAEISPEDRKDIEKELGVSLEKLANALGSEMAGSIIDFTVTREGLMKLEAIGALEVNDKDVVIEVAAKLLKSINKKMDIKKTTDNTWAVILPPHVQLPEGMKPVIGYRDRFLYASMDEETLKTHMAKSQGQASSQMANVQMTMNAPKGLNKVLHQLPSLKAVQYVASFADVYGPTEVSLSSTPRIIQASLVQNVSVVGVHKLPLEELTGKIKTQAAAVQDKKLAPLAGAIPAGPAVVMSTSTKNTINVYKSLLTALITPERVKETWAFIQEVKDSMATAPEVPSSEDMPEDMQEDMPGEDWEADNLEDLDSYGESGMESNGMEKQAAMPAPSEMVDLAKLAVIGVKSIGLFFDGWYGGEFAVALGNMPGEQEDMPQAAMFISTTDESKALENMARIFLMLNKANISGLRIKDKGTKKLNGIEYRLFSMADPNNKEAPGLDVMLAKVNGAMVITSSQPYLMKIAEAATNKSDSFMDEMDGDIPAGYTIYAYASGEFMGSIVQNQIDNTLMMIESQMNYEDQSWGQESSWDEGAAMGDENGDEAYEEEETIEDAGEDAMEMAEGEEMAEDMEDASDDFAEPGEPGDMESADSLAADEPDMSAWESYEEKSPDQIKLENLELAAKELRAVRGVLLVESFDGISPRLSLDVLLHPDKVADTEFIQKLYQYQSSVHEIDNLIRTNDAILYTSLSNLSDIMINVNENIIMKANDEGTVALRNNLAEMGTSIGGIAGALGSEAGFALLDIMYDRETFGYIPKFIAAVEVTDFDYIVQVLESAVAINNQNKANELYEGNVEALVEAGENMAVERRSDNLVAIRLPTLIQYGEDIRLLIGADGSHAFISLHPEVLDEFMAGGKGSSSGESATFKLSVNPQQARRFAEDILYVGADDETKPKAIRDRERAKGDFLISVMGIVGKGQISVRALPDRVSLDISQDLDREAIVKLPHGQGLNWARGIIVEKNFEACSNALGVVKNGMVAYSFDQESMSYEGVDPSGANLPQYMPIFYDCMPGQCLNRVKNMVEKACDPGSFKINVLEDGSDFVVHGKAMGSDCSICTTAYFQNFNLYSECLADPKMACE